MSITPQLDHYLSVRRSLGYDLRTDERLLRRFARFADQEAAPHIDTALFLRWEASLPDAGTSTRSARLGKVRLFAQWLSSIDPAHEVPPRGLLPDRSGRARPYIYSEAEIASIIAAAKAQPSIYGLRGLTCSTLFGLIAVTGLRISEALALDPDDLDGENGVLRVRRGKLGKERLLPLVRTMINWYRTGKEPAREMIRLTTYLGHTSPDNTFWYLEAVPELLDLAMARATSNGEEADL